MEDNDLEKIANDAARPLCLREDGKFTYTVIGGTGNEQTMCYRHFIPTDYCTYLRIKDKKQYCTISEKK